MAPSLDPSLHSLIFLRVRVSLHEEISCTFIHRSKHWIAALNPALGATLPTLFAVDENNHPAVRATAPVEQGKCYSVSRKIQLLREIHSFHSVVAATPNHSNVSKVYSPCSHRSKIVLYVFEFFARWKSTHRKIV